MILELGNKVFKLSRFSPIEGRKIMVKGEYPDPSDMETFCKDGKRLLMITNHISVKINDELFIPLSTYSMINNHVSSKEMFFDLMWAILEFNFNEIWLRCGMKSASDTLWELAEQTVSDILEELIQEI